MDVDDTTGSASVSIDYVTTKSSTMEIYDTTTKENCAASVSIDFVTSKSSIVHAFKTEVMKNEQVWFVFDDNVKCRLFWNCVDEKSGFVKAGAFCTTTFYKDPNDGRSHCSNCSIFSLVGMRTSAENPSCPHVCLTESVLRSTDASIETNSLCDFSAFLRNRLSSSLEVNVVKSSDQRITLLVVADRDRCSTAHIYKQESIVTIQKGGNHFDSIICCSNIQCKRKKLSFRLKSPKDYCPHFAKVWTTSTISGLIQEFLGLPLDKVIWGLSKSVGEISDGVIPAGTEGQRDVRHFGNRTSTPVVSYDVQRRRYVPSAGKVSPIPVIPDIDCVKWRDRRQHGLDVERNDEGLLIWNASGYLTGAIPCDVVMDSSRCPNCVDGTLRKHQMKDFKMHTSIGCVIRKRFSAICEGKLSWIFIIYTV